MNIPATAHAAPKTATPQPARFLCVHGHFYQPPRENPWLEEVETQDSAAPYHDWNERITAECYAPNGSSRILNTKNEIVRIVNNYAQISFNIGPTLLSWLKDCAPRAYRSVLDADVESARRFSGHGSALAQVYNHIIMPLANTRDKRTQIAWGVADFESRFGRKPEGMWLAETAVDSETLELLAEYGVLYTILAPYQCARVRSLLTETIMEGQTEEPWHETGNTSVDTRRPYLIRLKTGRTISIFFYDGSRSQAIAFDRLLNSGEGFAQRMASGFDLNDAEPQLVHVATDGESYGHHHRYGEMALSYALKFTEDNHLARLTNYGEFLARFPPQWEAQIVENTSWSCAHGVERWRSNCGCNGGKPGWNQLWRTPLRVGLDQLRDGLAPLVAAAGGKIFKDVDAARNAYVGVVLDAAGKDSFFAEHASHPLDATERETALKLMELERHALLMYTSCGWFFDDISGIETVQIIAYAARALELAQELFGAKASVLETAFVTELAQAQSNVAEEGTGATIYTRRGRALQVGIEQVAAHYAISSVFKTYTEHAKLFSFTVWRKSHEVINSGRGRLITGEAEIQSVLTEEHARLVYAVLHFGDQNITAVVKRYDESQAQEHAVFLGEVKEAVLRADLPAVIRLFDSHFSSGNGERAVSYSIRSLFNDEQRRVMKLILTGTLGEVENSLVRLYEEHASLLHFLNQTEVPRPSALALAASFAINVKIRRALEAEPMDPAEVRGSLAVAAADNITLDAQTLNFVADEKMKNAMIALQKAPEDLLLIEQAITVASTLRALPFPPNIWQAQNLWYDIYRQTHPVNDRRASRRIANESLFAQLGYQLSICAEQLAAQDRAGKALAAR